MSDQQQTNPFLASLPGLDKLSLTIWQELTRSAGDLDLPWALGVFATLDEQVPALRTMVLRSVDVDARTLVWHSDLRSAKFEQLQKSPITVVHFWDAVQRVQLVMEGKSQTHDSGELPEREWADSQLTSRRAYLGMQPPGVPTEEMSVNFPEQYVHRPPTEEESQAGKRYFGVITTVIEEFDLLILRQAGNVRAKFHWDGKDWQGVWVTP